MSDRRSFLGSLLALGAAPAICAATSTDTATDVVRTADPCGAVTLRTVSCGLPVGHEGKHHAAVMGRSRGKYEIVREVNW